MEWKSNQEKVLSYVHSAWHGPTPLSQLIPITTDMDNFPYNRFYRGMAACDQPRVFDREAGHRRWRNQDYIGERDIRPVRPFEGCFQIPCSTILPCIRENVYKTNINACVNISP